MKKSMFVIFLCVHTLSVFAECLPPYNSIGVSATSAIVRGVVDKLVTSRSGSLFIANLVFKTGTLTSNGSTSSLLNCSIVPIYLNSSSPYLSIDDSDFKSLSEKSYFALSTNRSLGINVKGLGSSYVYRLDSYGIWIVSP